MNEKELQQLSINAIRATVIDTINKAKSGHPGMALGSAPIMYTLFTRHLCLLRQEIEMYNTYSKEEALGLVHKGALSTNTYHIRIYIRLC